MTTHTNGQFGPPELRGAFFDVGELMSISALIMPLRRKTALVPGKFRQPKKSIRILMVFKKR